MSSAAMTPRPPLTLSTRACACGERTKAMWSMPSSRMSSRKRERPDRIRASSERRTGRPIVRTTPTAGEVNSAG
jgi:hypothetical protein